LTGHREGSIIPLLFSDGTVPPLQSATFPLPRATLMILANHSAEDLPQLRTLIFASGAKPEEEMP